ncbi:mechanosensitive ion channel family protein [Haloferax marisrubri]|uniref:Mechanosensitive ion channel family protein n=1 Tax=Haloferax marisrubri TaxID=1544719 RepID=A0A2P4NU84_9EURY|nr:mechanosensitive ion channel family protein [Haloferax marisrubri]POG56697.1 mechanosensitive ion channel family protein [Haloferax marisrubri]
MSPIRQSVGVAVGQLDPTQFSEYEELASATAGFAAAAVVVYLVGRLLLVPGVTRLVSARNRNNPTLESATETYAHVFVIALATLAGVVGAGYASVLTDTALIVAALTLVVGVAGQEVIGALISGLFLVADPDFNVGDWISWPGGEGVVEAVDFRVTRVRTVNNETISVPNTELTTNALTRPYGRERYRITERVDIAYADDAELALRELVETAREDDRVLADPEPTARIVEFAGSSIGLQAEFWVASPMDVSLVDVRSQYRRRVKRRFDEEGLTLGPASGREVSGRLDVDLVGERGGE